MTKDSQNKRIIRSLLVFLAVFAIALILIEIMSSNSTVTDIEGLKKATSLDEFIVSNPNDFMSNQEKKAMGLSDTEILSPVPLKVEGAKIIMAPKLLGGGDLVYTPVFATGNYFAIITAENLSKIFSPQSPEQAIQYIDFLRTKLGATSYDRSRITVWQKSDYDNIHCKDDNGNDLGLPNERPVTTATSKDNGWEITWIYHSQTVPAGFFREVFEVGKDGSVNLKEKEGEPFWSCGTGILF